MCNVIPKVVLCAWELDALKRFCFLAALAAGMCSFAPGFAEENDRPANLRLADFQFGPENRWTFSHIREVLPTVNIPHDGRRTKWLEQSPFSMDDFAVEFQGRRQKIDEIAEHQFIDGLAVLKDGKIVVEKYYGELTENRPHLMMSVSKSVVGLVAARLEELGVIDFSKPVAEYVPALTAGGWGPDSLRTLLDMRDGADYTEEYENLNSTVRQQDCAVGWTDADYCSEDGPQGGYEFFTTVGRSEENLGKFVYKSGSTDVIGWVLEEATGVPLAQLISDHIWQPMGAEFDANITVDSSGFVLADGGMSATLRDLARVGQLVVDNGKAFGQQVVPEAFIQDLHAQAADPDWPYAADEQEGPYYRSFWWGRGNVEKDIRGLGVHGQLLHIAPNAGIVVVIFSSWPRADGDGQSHGWDQLYELGNALVEKFRYVSESAVGTNQASN